jgi:carbamate kinase
MTAPRDPRLLVVALGGQALRGAGRPSGAEGWLRALGRTLPPLADVVAAGFRLAVTHGGGFPDEGLVPSEGGRASVPPAADLRRAAVQAAAGYAIQQVLGNLCRNRNVSVPIAVVVTRVRVDPADPAFHRPIRPVGPRYSAAQARRLARTRGWTFARVDARGRRRVVPAPRAREILEAPAIRGLLGAGVVVIAAGGGGVPVVDGPLGHRGVDAAVEEDWTAAILGTAVAADRLVLVTGVDRAEVGHRTRSIGIERLSVADARALLAAGEFPPASMGPKIEAAIEFVRAGGREAIITSLPAVPAALDGRTGTRVVP